MHYKASEHQLWSLTTILSVRVILFIFHFYCALTLWIVYVKFTSTKDVAHEYSEKLNTDFFFDEKRMEINCLFKERLLLLYTNQPINNWTSPGTRGTSSLCWYWLWLLVAESTETWAKIYFKTYLHHISIIWPFTLSSVTFGISLFVD